MNIRIYHLFRIKYYTPSLMHPITPQLLPFCIRGTFSQVMAIHTQHLKSGNQAFHPHTCSICSNLVLKVIPFLKLQPISIVNYHCPMKPQKPPSACNICHFQFTWCIQNGKPYFYPRAYVCHFLTLLVLFSSYLLP